MRKERVECVQQGLRSWDFTLWTNNMEHIVFRVYCLPPLPELKLPKNGACVLFTCDIINK